MTNPYDLNDNFRENFQLAGNDSSIKDGEKKYFVSNIISDAEYEKDESSP